MDVPFHLGAIRLGGELCQYSSWWFKAIADLRVGNCLSVVTDPYFKLAVSRDGVSAVVQRLFRMFRVIYRHRGPPSRILLAPWWGAVPIWFSLARSHKVYESLTSFSNVRKWLNICRVRVFKRSRGVE